MMTFVPWLPRFFGNILDLGHDVGVLVCRVPVELGRVAMSTERV